MPFTIRYNSPVVLTFALVAALVTLLGWAMGERFLRSVSSPARLDLFNVGFYFRLFTHVFAHQSWEHLISNLALILIVGPQLEARYGRADLAEMIAITAVITAVANLLLTDHSVLGASGVAFMMILLASITDLRRGEIPLTFILVALLYVGRELVAAVRAEDGISHLAHIVGALCGAAFGFMRGK